MTSKMAVSLTKCRLNGSAGPFSFKRPPIEAGKKIRCSGETAAKKKRHDFFSTEFIIIFKSLDMYFTKIIKL